ncbi:hypothetical protein Droror1_Dr00002721 [Drosera rotundifolia]
MLNKNTMEIESESILRPQAGSLPRRHNHWATLRSIVRWATLRSIVRWSDRNRLNESEPTHNSSSDVYCNVDTDESELERGRGYVSGASSSFFSESLKESFKEKLSLKAQAEIDEQGSDDDTVRSVSSEMTTENFEQISGEMYGYLINGNDGGFFQAISSSGGEADIDRLSSLVTAGRETPLHIAASAGQVKLIERILSLDKKNPLLRKNSNGDLAVHTAARSCQLGALDCLVNHWMQDPSSLVNILRQRNLKQKDTPLHIALKNRHQSMATYLAKLYPEASHTLNANKMSPLYLAIEAKYWDIVLLMLDSIPTPNDRVELLKKGKPVMHAVIKARNMEILKAMLEKCSALVDTFDDDGRTPLSYAAYIGNLEGVKYLLDKFRGEAFKKGKDGCFPIHWACRGGQIPVVDELALRSTISRDLLSDKGQNILHMAAGNGRPDMLKYLLEDMLKRHKELAQCAINLRDEDGNTPLHLAVINKHPKAVYVMTKYKQVQLSLENKHGCSPLDAALNYSGFNALMEERLTWLALTYAGASRSSHSCTLHKKTEDPDSSNKYKDRINTLQLMAILVATVTFAAAFTPPGGYNSPPDDGRNSTATGMAVLADRPFFKAFLISDTIAMYSSILIAVSLIWAQVDDLRLIIFSLRLVLPLLWVALTAMSVAFMVGIYLVVAETGWLAILIFIMGCISLASLAFVFIPLTSPPSISTWIPRGFFSIPLHLMLFMIREGQIETPV